MSKNTFSVALDDKYRTETAADIASQAASVLRGIEQGNLEAFMSRQRHYIKSRADAEMPLTELQQVEQLFKALEKQREINVDSIKQFFYNEFPQRADQTFDRLA